MSTESTEHLELRSLSSLRSIAAISLPAMVLNGELAHCSPCVCKEVAIQTRVNRSNSQQYCVLQDMLGAQEALETAIVVSIQTRCSFGSCCSRTTCLRGSASGVAGPLLVHPSSGRLCSCQHLRRLRSCMHGLPGEPFESGGRQAHRILAAIAEGSPQPCATAPALPAAILHACAADRQRKQ